MDKKCFFSLKTKYITQKMTHWYIFNDKIQRLILCNWNELLLYKFTKVIIFSLQGIYEYIHIFLSSIELYKYIIHKKIFFKIMY